MRVTRDVLSPPRRWPIRVATTATATLVVVTVMALAALGAWFVLRWVVHSAVDTTDRDRALDLATLFTYYGPEGASDLVMEPVSGVDLVRVIGPDGRPIAAMVTRGLERVDPLPVPAADEDHTTRVHSPGETDLRITSVGVELDGEVYAIEVGTDVRRFGSLLDVGALLFVGFIPLAGLATAAFVWLAMGRVLRPVEDIRSRVAEISASGRGERVPVPEAQDEIARLAETMNAMLARLDAARTAQVAFVGDASHELRSPLSTLSTMLELSSTSGRPVDVETVDELLLPEVVRMRSMVEDLLLLAKNDERGMPLRRDDVDLDDVVLAEATRLRGLGDADGGGGAAGGPAVRVHVEPARLVGDPDALVRVVRNLADNARRHARDTVSLGLTVDRSVPGAPRAVLTVDDDGDGVPPEQRATVFDRFARLDADRGRDTGGSGLGLAIVAEITRSHGGTVRVEDAPCDDSGGDSGGDSGRGGARFVVELPVEPLDELDA